MKIIGVLSWFNESPTWLVRTITSFARICDQVVAVDGRYSLFPHDMDWSPAPEAESILAAAEGAGVPLTMHIPRAPFFGNEVEKRNLLMSLAMVHAEPMVDWIIILDGDEYITHAAVDLREQVAALEEHAVTYSLEEYMDPYVELPPDGGVALKNSFPTTWRVDLRAMYRALPGIRYIGTHHSIGGWVLGDEAGGDRWVWLWGHEDRCQAHDLREHLIVRHENPRRIARRREQAASYYQDRDTLMIEQVPTSHP